MAGVRVVDRRTVQERLAALPVRVCEQCGARLVLRISRGEPERDSQFLSRRFCGQPCHFAWTRETAAAKRRFEKRIDKTAGCWLWAGTIDVRGYGDFWFRGRTDSAHRVAWAIYNGPIPEGLFVCHHCDNPKCVNPGHLFLGTNSENMKDCVAKGRHKPPNRWGKQKPAELFG